MLSRVNVPNFSSRQRWAAALILTLLWTGFTTWLHIRTFVEVDGDQRIVALATDKWAQPDMYARDYLYGDREGLYPLTFLIPVSILARVFNGFEQGLFALFALCMSVYTLGMLAFLRLSGIHWPFAVGITLLSSLLNRLAITGSYWGIDVMLNLTLYTTLVPIGGALVLAVAKRWNKGAAWLVFAWLAGLSMNVHSVSALGIAYAIGAAAIYLGWTRTIRWRTLLAGAPLWVVGAFPFFLSGFVLSDAAAAPPAPGDVEVLRSLLRDAGFMVFPWGKSLPEWSETGMALLFVILLAVTAGGLLVVVLRQKRLRMGAVFAIAAILGLTFAILSRSGVMGFIPATWIAALWLRKREIDLRSGLLLIAFGALILGGPVLQAGYRWLIFTYDLPQLALVNLIYQHARNLSLAYWPLFILMALLVHVCAAEGRSWWAWVMSLLTLGFAFNNRNTPLQFNEDTLALAVCLVLVVLWPHLHRYRMVLAGLMLAGIAVLAQRALGLFVTPFTWLVGVPVGTAAWILVQQRRRMWAGGVLAVALIVLAVLPVGRMNLYDGTLLSQIPGTRARVAASLGLFDKPHSSLKEMAAWVQTTPTDSLFWYPHVDCDLFRYYARRAIMPCRSEHLFSMFVFGIPGYYALGDELDRLEEYFADASSAEATAQAYGVNFMVYRASSAPRPDLPVAYENEMFRVYAVNTR